jgi:outer membrane receptor for ferrienterochelin and colicin
MDILKRSKSALLILLLIAGTALSAFAQKATIKGQVSEAAGPAPFANVFVAGTSTGTTTDFDGNYSLQLDAGNYAIVCTYVGAINDTMQVVLAPGEVKTLNIKLKENVQQLKEVAVTGTRQTNTEAAVLMEVKKSMQVMNAISSEMIEKSQDSDAAEVVKRVPGVTIVGNNYIMIRGLNERYNNVMLHDVFAPSMEADIKSFAFDIIPSSLIDRMLIYKSPAAELPGEFAGGVVKIYTKSIPDENATSVSLSTTYRQGSSLKNFKQTQRGFVHQLGLNDGYNDLPDGFPADIRRIQDVSDNGQLDRVGRSLTNNWIPEEVNSGLDKSFSFSKATKFKLFGKDAGNITAINYSNSRQIFDVMRSDYNAYDDVNDRSVPIYDFDDAQYNHNIRTGILTNFALRINPNHIIEFKNLFTVFNTTQYIQRNGYHYEFGYAPDNHSFDQTYRGIYSGQLTGKHYFREDGTRLNWTAGYGYSYRDQPDYRRYRVDVDTNSMEETLFIGVPVSPNYLGRFFSEMRENNQALSVGVEHDIARGKRFSPTLRAGVFFENKAREFNARNIGYVQSNFLAFDQGLTTVTIDSLFHPDNLNQTTGIKIAEQSNPSDSYTASNLLIAGYVGANLPITKKIILNTGVRLEQNDQQLRSTTLTGEPIIVDNPITSILPSANLAYNINEKHVLRLSYGKTVNRPEFRELAPFGFYDFNYNLVKKGSDTLRTPTIDNFDLRWEMYPNPTEVISVAVFYKRFIDPIETLFVPGGGSGGIKTFTYGNAKLATSYGVEVEARKSLEGLTNSPFIDHFSVLFNASLIESYVNLGREGLGQSNERPLQGQSPYIVNAGIYYQDKARGWQISLMYNLIGPRIFIIGFDAYPDIYEMPRNIMDFTLSKMLTKHLELKLGVGDVFNQPMTLLQDANADGKFSRSDDQIIQNYRYGRTYSVGLGYRF